MKISKLKKLRLKTAYYIICIVIDIVLVSVALTGFLVYFQDKADIPLVLVLSVNAVTLAFITVSVGGYVKGMSVGRAVLYKAISFFFFFGLSFTAYDYGVPAMILFEFIALTIALVMLFVERLAKRETTKNQQVREKVFLYKGEWVWDDVLQEYFKENGEKSVEDLSDEETDKLYRYSVMPLVYYFYWLLRKRLLSEAFYECSDADMIERCIKGEISPLDVLQDNEYQLHENDLSDKAAVFTKIYYEVGYLNMNSECFQFDYWDEVKNPQGYYYLNEFSWERCYRLYEKIESEYQKKVNYQYVGYEDEEPIKEVYIPRFDKTLEVYRSGKNEENVLSDEYIKRCADDLENLDEKQYERFNSMINDIYGDLDSNKAIDLFTPYDIIVYEPEEDDDIAYCVSGEADFEVEHGIAFYVRNGKIISFSYAGDREDIYDKSHQFEYIIASCDIDLPSVDSEEKADELVKHNKLVKVRLIPSDIILNDDPPEMVCIPPYAVREKELMDERLRGLSASWGGRLKIIYKAICCENSVIPQYITAEPDDIRGLFYFTVKIWS